MSDVDPFSTYDAAYVLGALSPEDRHAFEAHMEICSVCRASVRELAGLPGLLSQVPKDALTPVPDTPAELGPVLIRKVRRTRLRRHWVSAGAVVAAAAAVVAVLVAVPGVQSSETGPQAAAPVPAAGKEMVALGQFPVRASAQVEDSPRGSRIEMECSYTGGRDGDYILVAVHHDGLVDQLASWRAIPEDSARISVATSLPRVEIASLEIRTLSGKPLLRWTP